MENASKTSNEMQEGTGQHLRNTSSIDVQVAKSRKDKGGIHATRSGLLSRNIVQALVKNGESLRSIRKHEKLFRKCFSPQGTLGELVFDRWWASYLRLLLISKLEGILLSPDYPRQSSKSQPELQERKLPTLVSSSDTGEVEFTKNVDGEFSQCMFHELALAQRYDAHYSREASRMLSILLVMRNGGITALDQWLDDKNSLSTLPKGKI